jgi:hypothetical protein
MNWGITQFIVAWLTRLTGNPLTPAWYLIGGVTVGLLAIFSMPETAPVKTMGKGVRDNLYMFRGCE